MNSFIRTLFIIIIAITISSCSHDKLDDVQIVKTYQNFQLKQNDAYNNCVVIEIFNTKEEAKAFFQYNDRLDYYQKNGLDNLDYKNNCLLALCNYTISDWEIADLSVDSDIFTVTYRQSSFGNGSAVVKLSCSLYKIKPNMSGRKLNIVKE